MFPLWENGAVILYLIEAAEQSNDCRRPALVQYSGVGPFLHVCSSRLARSYLTATTKSLILWNTVFMQGDAAQMFSENLKQKV